MRVRNIHDIQQALNIAIFTNLAMQGIKHAVWLKFGEGGGNIAVDFNFDSIPARISRGLSTKTSANPAYRGFGRPSTHQDSDTFMMLAHPALSFL